MGSLASSCVRDCVRSSHEYAAEDLLHVSSEPPGLASSGSRPPGAPVAKSGDTLATPRDTTAASGVVPPVPNWFQVLQNGRQNRETPQETPRFDEVSQSPRVPNDTPRGNVGGEFRTPGPTPRDSPRTSEGQAVAKTDEVSYEGMYLGTMKHGQGKLRMTNSTYQGDFQNDVKHGQGALTWDDGRQYRGGFENDKFHGHAVMTWPDGRRYTGNYADDRKHGEGTFSWQDGRRYQGQWVAGKRHGTGVYTNAKGLTRRGNWQMDRPIQWEAPGAELDAAGGVVAMQPPYSSRTIESSPAEITPRDPMKIEVAAVVPAPASEQRQTDRPAPMASPREADEEVEVDLEVKVSNL